MEHTRKPFDHELSSIPKSLSQSHGSSTQMTQERIAKMFPTRVGTYSRTANSMLLKLTMTYIRRKRSNIWAIKYKPNWSLSDFPIEEQAIQFNERAKDYVLHYRREKRTGAD